MHTNTNTDERPITLKQAAAIAGGVHVETVRRWASEGIRGARLDTWLIGGRRYTNRLAIDRFMRAINGRPVDVCRRDDVAVSRRLAAHGL